MVLNFSLNRTELWRFENITNYDDFYSKNFSQKTTKFLEKFLEYKKILRIRMLVNMGPDEKMVEKISVVFCGENQSPYFYACGQKKPHVF